jgi:Bax protein
MGYIIMKKFVSVLALATLLATLATLPNRNPVFAAEKETVVDVVSALEVAAYLKKIGFYDIDNHPERLQAVPRTRIYRLPKILRDVWRENIPLRKSVFLRLGLSAVLQVNEKIILQRKRLLSLSLNNLTVHDRTWLSAIMARYGVAKADDSPTAKRLAELLLRVDALPPSLVMAQGALESGWIQSRFARKGQAVFGQWTSSDSGIKAMETSVRLAAFENPRQSLIAYMLHLNSHPAYKDLRKARAEMRHTGQPLDGYALAGHLSKYAVTGELYVKAIRRIIRQNGLTRVDTAKLAPGPHILFHRVDKK